MIEAVLTNYDTLIQIFTNIFVIIGGFVAIWQYSLNVKINKDAKKKEIELREKELYHRDKEKITKAIDLAGYYKDYILPNVRKLKNIYTETEIYNIIHTIPIKNMEHFDAIELNDNLTPLQIEEIKEKGKPYHFDTALKSEGVAIGLSDEKTITNSSNYSDTNTDKASEYAYLVIGTLNSLEYFSMYFVHNVADHTVVYQSLHMTFLEAVRMLYYDIASANTNGESKYYVNTIELFNIWNKTSEVQKLQEVENTRNMINIGKILQETTKKE